MAGVWTIAIIFVKEWWNNTYSAGLFLFSLHCDLVPERTYCQLIAVTLSTQGNLLEGFCLYSVLALKITRKQNIFMEISFWRASLSFLSFISYSNQISLGRSLGTILGHLKCLHYTKWVDPGWHSLSSLPVEFLWTCNSPRGHHKPKGVVHNSSSKYLLY